MWVKFSNSFQTQYLHLHTKPLHLYINVSQHKQNTKISPSSNNYFMEEWVSL